MSSCRYLTVIGLTLMCFGPALSDLHALTVLNEMFSWSATSWLLSSRLMLHLLRCSLIVNHSISSCIALHCIARA